ncbi:hypothetical protein Lesp02_50470 [Lentzea sp. NBRC 105346]|nr:hypothetical protein Lesp02_50470 [Lentzea sp. NBRC 105346]
MANATVATNRRDTFEFTAPASFLGNNHQARSLTGGSEGHGTWYQSIFDAPYVARERAFCQPPKGP